MFAHTVSGTNFNKATFASFAYRTSTTPMTSVTFGGRPMTFIRRDQNGGLGGVETWYMTDPPEGTNNITGTFGGNTKWAAGAVTLRGVAQTQPWINSSGLNATTITTVTINLTAPNKNPWLYDAIGVRNIPTITPGATQSQLWTQVTTGGSNATNVRGAVSVRNLTASGAGTYAMSETSNVSTNYGYHGFVIQPAGQNFSSSMF